MCGLIQEVTNTVPVILYAGAGPQHINKIRFFPFTAGSAVLGLREHTVYSKWG